MAATLLPRENARFLLGPTPVLLLADAPFHGELPVLGPGGSGPAGAPEPPALCGGWRIMPRLTLCLVDGPDGAGCLIPSLRAPTDMGAMLDWTAAVDAAGGALVVSLTAMPGWVDWDAIHASGEARGGFIRSIDAQPYSGAQPAAP